MLVRRQRCMITTTLHLTHRHAAHDLCAYDLRRKRNREDCGDDPCDTGAVKCHAGKIPYGRGAQVGESPAHGGRNPDCVDSPSGTTSSEASTYRRRNRGSVSRRQVNLRCKHTPTTQPLDYDSHPSVQLERPRTPSTPSLTMMGNIAIAATGSAHHQPSKALSPTPAKAMTDRYAQSDVCAASAARVPLRSPTAIFRFARASSGITTTDSARRAIPTWLLSGGSLSNNERPASTIT
jgi:hypothetical protein